MPKTSNKRKQRSKTFYRVVRHLLVGVAVLALAVGLGTFGYAQVYRNRILPGVVIGGVHVGGLSLAAARQRLADAVRAYESSGLRLDIGNGKLTPHLSEAGISIDLESSLQQAYALGRPTLWSSLFALPVLAKSGGTAVVQVDKETLVAFLADAERQFSVEPIEPLVRSVAGTPAVFPGHPGRAVSFPPVGNEFFSTLAQLEPARLQATVALVQPATSVESLETVRQEMATMTKAPIVLGFERRRYPVTLEQLSDWLEVNPNLQDASGAATVRVTVNAERSEAFFADVARDVRIEPKRVHGYDAVEYGEYAFRNANGRELDRDATIANLLTAARTSVANAEIVTKIVEPIIEAETVAAPRATGKVISVDLTKQAAFAHENGRLMFWTHVSTGKGGYKTPTGEWKVYAKTARQVMDGPGYYLPNVKWVLPYNGDYTLHGTYWHTNFGNPMSHGCTNLSEQDAKWFYDWAEVGTPVIIYES